MSGWPSRHKNEGCLKKYMDTGSQAMPCHEALLMRPLAMDIFEFDFHSLAV
jgi:hypothetical protein